MLQTLTKQNELCGEAPEVLAAIIHSAETANDWTRLAEAWDALAHYHWRRGEYKTARTVLNGGLKMLRRFAAEYRRERVMLTNTLLMVELFAKNYDLVIDQSPAAIADCEQLQDGDYFRAQAHRNYADALKHTSDVSRDRVDRAIEQFTAASYYFQQAGHLRHFAANDNNLAELYTMIGEFALAHQFLDRAEKTLKDLGDNSAIGQTCETRARLLLANNELDGALDVILLSVELIPPTERKVLAESYKTKGDIHARRGEHSHARAAYLEAHRLLMEAGDEG